MFIFLAGIVRMKRLAGRRLKLFLNVQATIGRLVDSETQARVFAAVALEREITSKQIAEMTGLYPSTVREAIVRLLDKGFLARRKAQQKGPGKKPYLYSPALPPDALKKYLRSTENSVQEMVWLEDYVKDGKENGAREVEVVIR